MIRQRSRALLGVMFVVAGLNHFRQTRFYERMMPDYLPAHHELVVISGLAEIGLGLLALVPGARLPTRWGLVALLLAVFPANINMALQPERFPSIPQPLLWARLPVQALLIAVIWWATGDGDR